jgi:hypothetical protein
VERRDEPAECGPFCGEHEAHAQQPADGAGHLAGIGQRFLHGSQGGGEVALEPLARRGEADPAAGPVENLDSQPRLEQTNGLAHPGLGDA